MFWPNLRKTIEKGLSEDEALYALTVKPAEILKVGDQVGTLLKGKMANFLITSSPIFDKENVIYQNWVRGKQYVVNPFKKDRRGTYDLNVDTLPKLELNVSGTIQKQVWKVMYADSTKGKVSFSDKNGMIKLSFETKGDSTKGSKKMIRLSGWETNGKLIGKGQLDDGTWINWSVQKTKDFTPKEIKEDPQPVKDAIMLPIPNLL